MTEKSNKRISRRSFLRGIAAVAAIDLTIAGCCTIPATHGPADGGSALGFQALGVENA